VVLFLPSEEYDGPEVPVMPKIPRDNDMQVCEYKFNDLLEIEWLIKGNLHNWALC